MIGDHKVFENGESAAIAMVPRIGRGCNGPCDRHDHQTKITLSLGLCVASVCKNQYTFCSPLNPSPPTTTTPATATTTAEHREMSIPLD